MAELQELVRRALAGEAVSQEELVGALWPVATEAVRSSRSLGRLRTSEDHVRDVTVAVVEKVSREGGRGLRLFCEWQARNAGRGFDDWLRIVAGNAARDHVRRTLGGRKRDGDALPSVKRVLNEFASSALIEALGVRPPVTAQQTAQELLTFARANLPEAQQRALELWLEGAEPEVIAEDLALEHHDDARKLVRAAVAALRRRFA